MSFLTPMSVFKRDNSKYYQFDFELRGERHRGSTKLTNLRAAETWENALKTHLAMVRVGLAKKHNDEPVPTLKEFRERFLEDVKVKCAEHPETIEFYTFKFDALLEYKPLASARLSEIDESLIDNFVTWMSRRKSRYKRHYSPATINRCLATLKKSMRRARRWRLIDRVPDIEMLDGERNKYFVLAREDEKKFLNACSDWLRPIASFLLETGIRMKELRKLRWANIHFQPVGKARRGYIAIRPLEDALKSHYANRNLSITKPALIILERQKLISRSEFVFVREDGVTEVSGWTLKKAVVRARTKAGLSKDLTTHSFRHTMLTRLGEAGADAFTIMRIAGHSSITVSNRYVHPTPDTLESAFERFETLNEVFVVEESGVDVPTVSPTVIH